MRQRALFLGFLFVPVVLAACKQATRGGDAAAADATNAAGDASNAAGDASYDARGGVGLHPSGPPRVPVIDFTPDASASPEERKRALASLLAGASPAGNLQEEATDPDAGFVYSQYAHLTEEEVEVAPALEGEALVGAATVTPPIPNVDRVLAGMRPRFRRCYRVGLGSDAAMSGRLTLTAKVLPSGEVDTVDVAQNTGLSSAVASCVSRGFKNAIFDAPGGSGSTLTVPLTFVPKK